jgi:MFS family permease
MNRWLILAVLTFARTVMGFQFQSVAAVSPLLLEQFQIGYALLGTVIGLYLLPGMVVAIPGGMLAQRFGDKRIAVLGFAAMTAGGLLTGLAEGLPMLMAGRVIAGAGAVMLNVVVTKMVTDWFQNRGVTLALGILVTSWPLGIACAMVVLPTFAAAFGTSMTFHLTAIASAIAGLLVLFCYRAPATAAAPAAGLRFDLTRQELTLAALSGAVWTCYNVGFIMVLAFGTGLLAARGYGAASASAIVSAASWVIIPAVPLGAWLAQRLNRPDATMLASFVASAVAIFIAASFSHSVLAFAVIGLLGGPPAGLIMTLPGQSGRPERRAVVMGVYFTCYYVGMGVLPGAAGWLRDVTGNAAAPLWMAAAMLVLAGGFLLAFRRAQARTPVPA